MGIGSKKTEGGSGGKRGHGNMAHWEPTEVIKKEAKRNRRSQGKKIIKDAMNESHEDKFLKFLESLKGNGSDHLIESVKEGFQAVFEYIEYDEDFEDSDPMPELNEMTNKINEYENSNYIVEQLNDDYFNLNNDGKLITEGDFNHIHTRLNDIIRENGLQYQD